MKRFRLPFIGAMAALVIGLGAGSAYAYFATPGSGSTATTAGSPSPVTVLHSTGTVTNGLFPGGTGDLRLTLNNPNNDQVTITSVSGNGAVTGSGGVGSCSSTGVSVTPGLTGLTVAVAPGNPVSVVIPGAASMNASSDDGCEGATFSIPVNITVRKG